MTDTRPLSEDTPDEPLGQRLRRQGFAEMPKHTNAELDARCAELQAQADASERRYKDEYAIVDRVWQQLGITDYAGARGLSIYDLISELQDKTARLDALLPLARRAWVMIERMAKEDKVDFDKPVLPELRAVLDDEQWRKRDPHP